MSCIIGQILVSEKRFSSSELVTFMVNFIAHSIKRIRFRPNIHFGGYWPVRSKNTTILPTVSTSMKVGFSS